MTDNRIRLLFAGGLTLLASLFAFVTVMVGILASMDLTATLALAGVFTPAVSAGIAYFMGYKNGVNGVTKSGAP